MTALALIALAAWWRCWDGMSHRGLFDHAAVRNVIGVTVALAAAYVGAAGSAPFGLWLLSPWPLWLACIASLSLIAGRTDWDDGPYMMARYGVPALVAAVPAAYFGAVSVEAAGLYIAACSLAGASYSAFHRIDHLLPVFPSVGIDGWDAYGRMVCGGVITGGLALL